MPDSGGSCEDRPESRAKFGPATTTGRSNSQERGPTTERATLEIPGLASTGLLHVRATWSTPSDIGSKKRDGKTRPLGLGRSTVGTNRSTSFISAKLES